MDNILQEEFGLKCVTAKWIPDGLEENKKANRVESCQKLLDTFAKRLIKERLFVCDEKWVYLKCFPPQTFVYRWVPGNAVGQDGDMPTIIRKSMCHKN